LRRVPELTGALSYFRPLGKQGQGGQGSSSSSIRASAAFHELGAGFKAALLHRDPDVYAVRGVASREECAGLVALFNSMMLDAEQKPSRSCLRSHSKRYPEAFEEWRKVFL